VLLVGVPLITGHPGLTSALGCWGTDTLHLARWLLAPVMKMLTIHS